MKTSNATTVVDSKKKIHHRNLYMVVGGRGGAIARVKQLPIFWKESLAKKVGERVVKVSVNW